MFSYVSRQWAAVIIQISEIIEPPQRVEELSFLMNKAAWKGNCPGLANIPPEIPTKSSSFWAETAAKKIIRIENFTCICHAFRLFSKWDVFF